MATCRTPKIVAKHLGSRLEDTETITAHDLASSLRNSSLTVSRLLEIHKNRIDALNPHLHALISTGNWTDIANDLETELRAGKPRSPLHGFPLVVKDNIQTAAALGMPTTGGDAALLKGRAPRNANVVQKCVDAGMVVIGKANLTVCC